jgi:branched-chain amino acid transport system permease protein
MVKRGWPVWLLFAIVLMVAPRLFSSGLGLTILSQIGTLMIIMLSYNMLFGQTGLLSFGHAIPVGLGAFAAAHVLNAVAAGHFWLPVSLVPLVAGLGGAVGALLMGLVTARLSKTAFAMITLALGEMVAASALMFPAFFGGEAGIRTNRVIGEAWLGLSFEPAVQVYGLIAVWLFVCTLAMAALTRTPLGRLANAVRDNPERVAFIGFDPALIRLAMMILSGFFAGIGGGLSAINFEIVNAESVGTVRSGAYLLFTFIGGSTLFAGPMIGAIVSALTLVLLSELTRAWLLYLGLFFLVTVLFAPRGLAGLLADHGAAVRNGRWRVLLRPWLLLVLALLPLCTAVVLLVEMAYTLQFAPGQSLHLAGLSLDPAAGLAWSGALLALVSAASATRCAHARLRGALQQLDGVA